MTNQLLVGGLPSNLNVPPVGGSTPVVEGDVYNICERIKELDTNLFIIMHPEDTYPYVIMEHTERGTEEFVYKTKELDARVIDRLQYMRAVPLQKRLEIIEAEERAWELLSREQELEELYEDVGRPMWTELDKCNFIDRPVSYPIVNKKRKLNGSSGAKTKG